MDDKAEGINKGGSRVNLQTSQAFKGIKNQKIWWRQPEKQMNKQEITCELLQISRERVSIKAADKTEEK